MATAASAALPPRSSTLSPTAEPSQWVLATMPKSPRSSGRVVKVEIGMETSILLGTIRAYDAHEKLTKRSRLFLRASGTADDVTEGDWRWPR